MNGLQTIEEDLGISAQADAFVATAGPHYMIPTTFSDSQYRCNIHMHKNHTMRYLGTSSVCTVPYLHAFTIFIKQVPVPYHTLFLNAEVDIASGSLDKEQL